MATFTTPDGVELYYKDWGTGRPVVFSHGWPLNADMWEYQMNFLAERGFRCIAHDRRGFGRSSQPWNGYDYDTFAADLHGLIESLDLKDAILVGFSMGGGEVARYLGRYGSARIAKVALVGAVTPLMIRRPDHPDGVDPAVFDGIRAGILDDRPAFFDGFGPVFAGANRPGATVSRAILNWTQMLALQAGLKGTLDCVAAFSETDFRTDLTKFDVPTLVVHGDDDQVVPLDVTGRAAAAAIKGAQFKVYKGAPHALYVTHADQLNQDLLAFGI
ncbi:alpha/beta fold hydrolase [Paraburkholderia caballeronis]|uniref:Pimeloyl-ACP methyl ester carboxylesterase n=1 Tax=Paraburkholderia caballeronis TaxID=416943 RepID=A0A1H7L5C6_9BURK|nr:alpha/beta hydrolase [Paraburkholderia caballeronis]PXW28300.1 pimeloyl-ACP methyl ester carboxylesterase [Paraburkholderia caballeronis]PXX03666.1 pimeloyl-ACP methyl ester carboxylesterase [Paraburkholderia caballeronis]RAK04410.1 pimeloyl-ACP methyl ester carboxylesterase [Paraburkholderia caballeronis]SED81286.1 Pimeloyl-ACP methyl ester carboxylesterase [Paraburkholderia caballeronis]SEK94168.1 Pimeloyl-ACP methyl ester carboxylesterase [Paraburkholderia caballeronis]